MLSIKNIILRLFVAAILGGIIGYEREINERPAGFRTHILVSMGSCLMMLVSTDAYLYLDGLSFDPQRIASQVVSGVSFIGAGTIMVNKDRISGLTTAATIWVSAAMGLSIGIGYYTAALTTTLISIILLMLAGRVEQKLNKKNFQNLSITLEGNQACFDNISSYLVEKEVSFVRPEITKAYADGEMKTMIDLSVRTDNVDLDKVIKDLIDKFDLYEVDLH